MTWQRRLVSMLAGALLGRWLYANVRWARAYGNWVAGLWLSRSWRRSGELDDVAGPVRPGWRSNGRRGWTPGRSLGDRLAAWIVGPFGDRREGLAALPGDATHPDRSYHLDRRTDKTPAPTAYEVARAEPGQPMCDYSDAQGGCGMFADAWVHTLYVPAESGEDVLSLHWHPFVPGPLAPAENSVITPCQATYETPAMFGRPAVLHRCVLPLWHSEDGETEHRDVFGWRWVDVVTPEGGDDA